MNPDNKEQKPIRILHVLGSLGVGGAESRVMDLYRHIDRNEVQFDFLVHTDACPESGGTSSDELMKARTPQAFDSEILSLGGRIYALPRPGIRNLAAYRRAAAVFFRDHHDYAAVEGHMTSTASIYLPIAKKAGIPCTMAHVRSGGSGSGVKKIMTDLLRSGLAGKADRLLSCTMEAGVFVYGKKAADRIEVIPNAIDTRFYAFSKEDRYSVRHEFGIPDEAFVIGHVGRFDPMKNQKFLVDLAAASEPCVHLLFVGEGAGMQECREAAERAGLAERVHFAGLCNRDRTAKMYQAFDMFALPSLYEGMPGTAIEAQASGLECLLSDSITQEAELTCLVKRLPLSDPDAWKTAVKDTVNRETAVRNTAGSDAAEDNDTGRQNRSAEALASLDDAGYNISTLALRMQKFYQTL